MNQVRGGWWGVCKLRLWGTPSSNRLSLLLKFEVKRTITGPPGGFHIITDWFDQVRFSLGPRSFEIKAYDAVTGLHPHAGAPRSIEGDWTYGRQVGLEFRQCENGLGPTKWVKCGDRVVKKRSQNYFLV